MKRSPNITGSVMLEFAIVSFLFIMILGFFFDILVIYFKYQVLVNTTTRAARAFAINYDISQIDGASKAYISNNFFLDASSVQVTAGVQNNPCRLIVQATWPNACIFCFFPGLNPQAQGEAVIEDECGPC